MGGLIGGGGSKKAKKNATAASNTQLDYNTQTANMEAGLNRYNETNPYGSVQWTKDPTTGQWTVAQTASPQLQGAINSSLDSQTAGNRAVEAGAGRIAGTVGTKFDMSGLPDYATTPRADAALRTTPQGQPVQTSLGNTGNPFAAVFGAGAVPEAQNVTPGAYQATFGDAGPIQRGVAGAGPIQAGVNLQTSLGNAGPISGEIAQTGPIQRNVNAEAYQRALDFSGAPELYGSGDYSADAENMRGTLNSRAEADIGRDYDLQRSRLEQQLADQGIPLDSAAAKVRLDEINRGRDEALSNARAQNFTLAGQEQNRLSGLALTARQQAVGETTTAGGFTNDAAGRTMQDRLATAQYGLGAQGQEFGQAATRTGMANDAQAQTFEQMLRSGAFGNDAMLAAAQYGLQAQGQQYGQNANDMQQGNAAQSQAYEQAMGRAGFGNDATGRQFADQLAASGQNYGQAANTQDTRFGQQSYAQRQAFEQALGKGEFYNSGQQQQFGQNMDRAGLYNSGVQQDFGNNMASSQQQNALRDQAFNERATARNIPIAEVTSMMNAQQPTPQLPSVQTPAIGVAPVDYLGAYGAERQAQAAKKNGITGAVGSLGGAAIKKWG